MQPFLYQIASLFLRTYGAKVSRFAFVFPNRRAGIFFRKYLSEVSGKPLFSPAILTINDLFLQLSGKQTADRTGMLFTLYRLYLAKSNTAETFDEFLYWGEMLLNDFDDVDKYMVDARMLFTNVTDLKQLESDFTFLTPQQVAAIRSFWSAFSPKKESPGQENFRALWEILYDLYTQLRAALAGEGKGYEGMIFREVAEALQQGGDVDLPYEQVVFVGLNALTTAEERLLDELRRRGIADFYWDYASPRVKDPDNKASFFAGPNLKKYPSALALPEEGPQAPATIEVIGIPSGIGQAKQVHALLEELAQETEMTGEEALRTAIVLPDERLLVPVLHAIPETIRKINVTMGYPLADTPVAVLMDYVWGLQKNVRYIDRLPTFYFRDVLPVLNHPYVLSSQPGAVASLVKDITTYNKVYIPAGDLCQSPLLRILFTPVEDSGDLPDYVIRVLGELNRVLYAEREDGGEDDGDDVPARAHDLEQEFVFQYFTTVNRLREIIRSNRIEMRTDTFFRLLKRLTETLTIPFQGEPLSGLQVMGVLETRALDFDRLIILSMNEGTFPMKKAANSFIPYNLRRGFGLPTYEHQDSVWAYHFYRLIYRASRISLVYDTRSGGLQTGEMSRFIHQLRYHYEAPLRDKLVVYNVSSSATPPIRIEKTPEVLGKLGAFREGGGRALSASAINTYLDCPLKFYFSVVEGVEEEEEVSETIESNVFGSIVHKVMEELYQPLCGKMVTADILKLMRKDRDGMTQSITRAFAELFFKSKNVRPLTGQNYLTGEMIRKYVDKILEHDIRLTPFRYIESEKKMADTLTLADGSTVCLKGFIDRIDETGGDTLRIIDYKSGSGTDVFTSVGSLFALDEKDRAKAVMQVFMYAWMYSHIPGNGQRVIKPAIYYIPRLFREEFSGDVYRRTEPRKREAVDRFGDYAADFEQELRTCLDGIFDPAMPFAQTSIGKACRYCPFKSICGR